jgi:hypothetical protein
MNIYKANDAIAINDVQPGIKFEGSNGIIYTITERQTVTWDDAPITVTYLTVTDGINSHVIDINELIKVGA